MGTGDSPERREIVGGDGNPAAATCDSRAAGTISANGMRQEQHGDKANHLAETEWTETHRRDLSTVRSTAAGIGEDGEGALQWRSGQNGRVRSSAEASRS